MTLRGIVQQLRTEGHRVSYRVRKDGSIRVTSIDGRKFSAQYSAGNAEARRIAGVTLSERRTRQLEKGRAISKKVAAKVRKAKKANRTYVKKAPLSPEFKKELRKAQRAIRQKGKGQGTVTASNVRYNIEEYGEEEAMKKLKQQTRYHLGYAYPENIQALYERMKYDGEKLNSPELVALAEKVLDNAAIFREIWIERSLDILYDLEEATKKLKRQSTIKKHCDLAVRQLLAVYGW